MLEKGALETPFLFSHGTCYEKKNHFEKSQSITVHQFLLRQNSKHITKNLSKQKARNRDSHN